MKILMRRKYIDLVKGASKAFNKTGKCLYKGETVTDKDRLIQLMSQDIDVLSIKTLRRIFK